MRIPANSLFEILKTIEGSGSFFVKGSLSYPYIGLVIAGYGEVGMPIHPDQAKGMIQKVGKIAPYGKGRETLRDTSVRNSFEVDASMIEINGKKWPAFLKKILKQVKEGLGLEDKSIEAKLYKMLIYEEGGFFLPHKDTEKGEGMFGTLIITLPSEHEGGELFVRFDGQEKSVDFTKSRKDKLAFAAFYADCEHEVKPVGKGYRVSLVYNLHHGKGSQVVAVPKYETQIHKLTNLLDAHRNAISDKPLVVVLGHQYTPANFALDALKGHDGARARALIEASQRARYYSCLALVAYHETGEPDYGYPFHRSKSRQRYPYDYEVDDFSNAPMGYVIDSDLGIDCLDDGENPGLGYIPLEFEDLTAPFQIGEDDDPIDRDYEGYMGNYGPTLDFWYYYGAVVLWPKEYNTQILLESSVPTQLDWLEYFMRNWKSEAGDNQNLAIELYLQGLVPIGENDEFDVVPSLDILATFLIKCGDVKLLKKGSKLFEKFFDKLDTDVWVELLLHFGVENFEILIQNILSSGVRKHLDRLLAVIDVLSKRKEEHIQSWVCEKLRSLPDAIAKLDLTKEADPFHEAGYGKPYYPAHSILLSCMSLQFQRCANKQWIGEMSSALTADMGKTLIKNILLPVLKKDNLSKTQLGQSVLKKAIAYQEEVTKNEPQPPSDWSRSIPELRRKWDMWETLRVFMESPIHRTIDFVAVKQLRTEMERQIKQHNLDLDMETIRKGSPHTLRLTKNDNSFRRKHEEWQENVRILETLKKMI